jgi:signal transduction histidine kinase
MFLKILRNLKNLRNRLNLRLAAIYSGLFIASFLLLFGVTYIVLETSLNREDRSAMRLTLLELWTHYQLGGVLKLRMEVLDRGSIGGEGIELLRVADANNQTLFLSGPEEWQSARVEPLLKAAVGRKKRLITLRMDGRKYLLESAYVRLTDGNILQVGMNVTSREYLLSRIRNTFGIGVLPLIVLSFLTGTLLAARSLRPIAQLSATARSIIDTGKIDARLSSQGGRDELDELVVLFNRMLERIEVLVMGMRDSLDNVAHDLRTPMTRLKGTAELALRASSNREAYREALEDCLEESEQIINMLNTLMDISEAETGAMKLNLEHVALSGLIEECIDIYSYPAEEKEVSLTSSVPEDLHVYADPVRLRQAVLNLIDNGIKYTPQGGRVAVSGKNEDADVTIEVCDTGTGIDGEELEHIWNRLYRGEKHRSTPGLGLGLSLVRAIIRAHQGTVHVASKPSEGSTFSLSLPNITKL